MRADVTAARLGGLLLVLEQVRSVALAQVSETRGGSGQPGCRRVVCAVLDAERTPFGKAGSNRLRNVDRRLALSTDSPQN